MDKAKIFSKLADEYKDFDELTGADCVSVVSCKNKGTTCTLCMIWDKIVKLDSLLAESKENELALNGISKEMCLPDIESEKLYKGTNYDQEFVDSLKTTANSIIFLYKTWKESRERFLKGKPGGFYDFGELTPLIYNLAIITGILQYLDASSRRVYK